ncbi:MAG: helix-turn-helix transcriptional regulator [Subdoligranulum sp.]|nr:helix-turn-helix transcriptional regulator [Subdoligranulum sp.]
MTEKTFDPQQYQAIFQDLITCGAPVYTWQYGSDGHLSETNCPDLVMDAIFEHTGCKEYMLNYGRTNTQPLILGAELGLAWCAVFAREDNLLRSMYVLGPVFNTEASMRGIETAVQHLRIPQISFKTRLIKILANLPTVSASTFFQYALMLHYCVTGEKLHRSDIQYQMGEAHGKQSKNLRPKDRHRTYATEQALLRMVREGDLDYRAVYEQAGMVSNGVRIDSEKPLMQIVITGAVFTSLCVRAAIEGGLSPESAYSLGDSYIQSMADSRTISELTVLMHEMYDDFIHRVHQCRTNPELSKQIRSCCDYIEFHLEEDIPLSMLAQRIGYTEPYLSRKFKKEMGINISDYIRFARVERAKWMLTTTDLPIAQIAQRLHFCSSSYFSEIFRGVAGQTPQQWRAQKGF